MASSTDSPIGLKNGVILILIIASTIFSSKSAAASGYFRGSEGAKQVKVVLGSRPPKCVNKCLSCRPCVATLVVPNHPKNRLKASSFREDENYYLLSWKCRCGNKLFRP